MKEEQACFGQNCKWINSKSHILSMEVTYPFISRVTCLKYWINKLYVENIDLEKTFLLPKFLIPAIMVMNLYLFCITNTTMFTWLSIFVCLVRSFLNNKSMLWLVIQYLLILPNAFFVSVKQFSGWLSHVTFNYFSPIHLFIYKFLIYLLTCIFGIPYFLLLPE